ncbi:MAG: hypothetical protein AAF750_05945 [Planctomycetota bacterium]
MEQAPPVHCEPAVIAAANGFFGRHPTTTFLHASYAAHGRVPPDACVDRRLAQVPSA